jgi:CBS domain-containing protein
MGETARDVMDTHFYALQPRTPVVEAARALRKAREELNHPVFGMIVVDDDKKLIGMVSMYDILLLTRPKHIHIWGEMVDIDATGIIRETCSRARAILVGDIMTTNVVTVTPDTHLLLIVDIMLKRHIRRIPVLEDGEVVGIVYLSKVFEYFVDQLIL